MNRIRVANVEELGLCPAAVELYDDGSAVFLVNEATFPDADPFSQKFYLAHELGHYLLHTGVEEEADAFALGALAGTERKSLKKCIDAAYYLGVIPPSRLQNLLDLSLTIDKKNSQTMKKLMYQQEKTYRADGEVATDTSANERAVQAASVIGEIIGGNNRRRAGVRINNVFFSLESMCLTAIFIVLVIIACKK